MTQTMKELARQLMLLTPCDETPVQLLTLINDASLSNRNKAHLTEIVEEAIDTYDLLRWPNDTQKYQAMIDQVMEELQYLCKP